MRTRVCSKSLKNEVVLGRGGVTSILVSKSGKQNFQSLEYSHHISLWVWNAVLSPVHLLTYTLLLLPLIYNLDSSINYFFLQKWFRNCYLSSETALSWQHLLIGVLCCLLSKLHICDAFLSDRELSLIFWWCGHLDSARLWFGHNWSSLCKMFSSMHCPLIKNLEFSIYLTLIKNNNWTQTVGPTVSISSFGWRS